MIVALVLYFGMLNAPFLYDDFLYVVENTQLREVGNAPQLWITPYHKSGLYRPVTATSYLIDDFLFSLDPHGFHLSNVLLYLVTIFLFSVVIREVGGSRSEALLASLVFAAHPVHTEAVSWIVGRAEVLAGLFLLLGVDWLGKVSENRSVALPDPHLCGVFPCHGGQGKRRTFAGRPVSG